MKKNSRQGLRGAAPPGRQAVRRCWQGSTFGCTPRPYISYARYTPGQPFPAYRKGRSLPSCSGGLRVRLMPQMTARHKRHLRHLRHCRHASRSRQYRSAVGMGQIDPSCSISYRPSPDAPAMIGHSDQPGRVDQSDPPIFSCYYRIPCSYGFCDKWVIMAHLDTYRVPGLLVT